MSNLENCAGCGAAPGSDHGEWCDHAMCPGCGQQLVMCGEHEDPDRPARWNGVDPKAEVAQKLNWWTTAVGIDHLVEDYTRVIFADALGMIAWDREAQRYVVGQVDEARLTDALARG